ncbi:MAG TPA: haloacid dehalogenase-like hydrolase [Patescibacteria group bacterium]|nr:haloacid dehalogenase-like hydrolase [Patescibacteria group bacterium]
MPTTQMEILHRTKPEVPEGLHVFDPETFARKTGRMMMSGEGIKAVFDYDGTLTKLGHCCWRIVESLLPENGEERKSIIRRREVNIAKERSTGLTARDSFDWSVGDLSDLRSGKVKIDDLKSAARAIQLRDGTTRLLGSCRTKNVPVEVHSAGIKNIIVPSLEASGITGVRVESTELNISDGYIVGWDPNTLIHVANKQDLGIARYEATRRQYPNTIVVGDGLHDILMAPRSENVLGIFVCDQLADGGLPTSALDRARQAGFDAAVVGSFEPLAALMDNY